MRAASSSQHLPGSVTTAVVQPLKPAVLPVARSGPGTTRSGPGTMTYHMCNTASHSVRMFYV